MADNITMKILAQLDIARSTKLIQEQIKQLEQSLKLNISYNKDAFNNINKDIQNMQTKLSQAVRVDDSSVLRTSNKITQAADGSILLEQNMNKAKTAIGEYTIITEKTNKNTEKTTKIIEKIVNNEEKIKHNKKEQLVLEKQQRQQLENRIASSNSLYKQKQREIQMAHTEALNINKTIEAEKKKTLELQEQLNLYKQQMLGGQGFKGQLDIFDKQTGGKYSDALLSIRNQVNTLNTTTPELKNKMKQLKLQFSSLKQEATGAGTVITRMVEGAIKFMRFYLVGGLLVGVIRQLKDSITVVKELDEGLTQLRKVSGESLETLSDFAIVANESAKNLGATTKEVVDATTEFARLGYAIKEASKLAEESILLSLVGNMSIERASTALISTIKAFGIDVDAQGENVRRVIDMINEVGNKFAISQEGIADILQRSSSAMVEAGNTIEQTIALGTGAQEIVQSAQKVGTALRTVSMRIRGVSDEGEDLTDLIPVMEKQFNAIGLSLKKDNQTFKSTYEIIEDLSKVWHTLTDMQRADILESVAGKRQSQVIAAMIRNFESVDKSLIAAQNSMGSAQAEYERAMDSIAFKANKLKETMSELWIKSIDREEVKNFVDILTSLASTLVFITEKVGLLNIAFLGLAVLVSTKLPLAFTALFTKLGLLTASANGVAIAFNGITMSATAMNAVLTLGVVVAIIGLIAGFNAMIKSHEKYIKSINDSINSIKEQISEIENEKDSLNSLAEEYNKLLNKTELTIQEKKRLNELNKTLISNYPKLNTSIDSEGKLLYITADALKEVNDERERSIRLQKQDLIDKQKELIKAKKTNIALGIMGMEAGSKKPSPYVRVFAPNMDSPYEISKRQHEKAVEESIELSKELQNIVLGIKDLSSFSETLVFKSLDEFTEKYRESLGDLSFDLDNFIQDWEDYVDALNSEEINKAAENYHKAFETKNIDDLRKSYKELDNLLRKSSSGLIGVIDLYGELDDIIELLNQKNYLTFRSFEDLKKETDNVYNSLSNLASAYNTLAQGENLSLENIKSLIIQYPTLANYLSKTNDLTFNRGEIIKNVWEIEKQVETKRLKLEEESIKKEIKLQEARLASVDYSAYMAGIDTPEITDLREQLKLTDALIKLYDTDIDSFSKTSSSKELYQPTIDALYEYQKALDDINIALERNNLLTDLAENDDKIRLLSERIDLYKQEQKALNDINQARRSLVQQDISKLQGYGFDIFYDPSNNELIIKNMDRLGKFTGDTAKEIEGLIKNILDLNKTNQDASNQWWNLEKTIKDANSEIENVSKSIREFEEEQKKAAQDLVSSYFNHITASVNEQIEALEDLKKQAKNTAEAKIELIQKEIDALEETNDLLKEQEERQKRLDDLAKQRRLLSNIRQERNVRMLVDGEWQWVADPRKLRDETEKLQEMEEDYYKWEEDIAHKHQIQQLKDQIKTIQDNLYAKEKGYDRDIELLKTYLKDQERLIDFSTEEQITSWDMLISKLEDLGINYEEHLGKAINAIHKYNDAVSGMKNSGSLSVINTSTSKGAKNYESTSDDEKDKVLAEMASNSRAWHYADEEEKRRLEKRNKELGKKVDGEYDPKTGKWNVLQYEKGGIVDYTGNAIVDGTKSSVETVFNAEQGKKLFDFVKNLPNSAISLINNIKPIAPNLALSGNNSGKVVHENYNFYKDSLNVKTNDSSRFVSEFKRMVRNR